MRKFRVWDKVKGMWAQDLALRPNGMLVDLSSSFWNGITKKDQDRYIVQYSTGTFDKKKKEIFEGDIVRDVYYECRPFGYFPDRLDRCENIYEVKYDGAGFNFIGYRDSQNVIEDFSREIIGNIIETPNWKDENNQE